MRFVQIYIRCLKHTRYFVSCSQVQSWNSQMREEMFSSKPARQNSQTTQISDLLLIYWDGKVVIESRTDIVRASQNPDKTKYKT